MEDEVEASEEVGVAVEVSTEEAAEAEAGASVEVEEGSEAVEEAGDVRTAHRNLALFFSTFFFHFFQSK